MRLLAGIRNFRFRFARSEAAQPAHWRKIPKVNLIGPSKDSGGRRSIVRVLLIVALVGQAWIIWSLYSGEKASEKSADVAKTQLQSFQKQLKTEQDQVAALQDQIAERKKQMQLAEQRDREIVSGHLDWEPVLEALFKAEIPGVSYLSVGGRPNNEMELLANVDDAAAFVRFQEAFQKTGDTMHIQSVSWEKGDNLSTLRAFIGVRR